MVSDRRRTIAWALETLGLSLEASPDEIKRTYKRLVRQHHPDRVTPEEREQAQRRTAGINEAYGLLYEEGRLSASSTHSNQGATPPPNPPPQADRPQRTSGSQVIGNWPGDPVS